MHNQDLSRAMEYLAPYLKRRREAHLDRLYKCSKDTEADRIRGSIDELDFFLQRLTKEAKETYDKQEKRGNDTE